MKHTYNYDFNHDLAIGHSGECYLINHLCQNFGYTGYQVPDAIKHEYDYRLVRCDKDIKVEIKTDFAAARTNNFFVETGNYNGTSQAGLLTSKADVYAFVIPTQERYIAISKKRLLTLVYASCARPVYRPSFGVVIPISIVIAHGKQYELLDNP